MNDDEIRKIFPNIRVIARALPQDKSRLVDIAKSMDLVVGMTGDGVNDSIALKKADVGFAMGSGTEVAKEASDIVIMNDEPSKILSAIKLSKKTMRIVKQNIIFAIFVKVLVLILSAIGISTMWEAVFADVGVSIIAILNALRILKSWR